MLINLLTDSVSSEGTSSDTTRESLGMGFYIPLIVIGAILILLVSVMLIAKKKGLGPIPANLTLQMPKATFYLGMVFVIAFVIGAFLAWFLLPKEMEYRLLSQILITVVAAGLCVFFPLTARLKLTLQGNEICYRPMVGKERIYSFKDIQYVVIKAGGFDGNVYKYYDKDGNKLFSFATSTPYADTFFERVKAENKHLKINDKRIVGPTVRK